MRLVIPRKVLNIVISRAQQALNLNGRNTSCGLLTFENFFFEPTDWNLRIALHRQKASCFFICRLLILIFFTSTVGLIVNKSFNWNLKGCRWKTRLDTFWLSFLLPSELLIITRCFTIADSSLFNSLLKPPWQNL